MLFIFYAFPVCLLLFSEFYIIELDDTLVVKNAIFPFWKKKIYFKDVVKINVVYLGGCAVPYMQIITDKKRACRYYINAGEVFDAWVNGHLGPLHPDNQK